MMGSKVRTVAPLLPVTLEDLVPADHSYRHLERKFDLAFVRDVVRHADADVGRPSIDPVDPVVCFNLQLVMFFEGIRSERQLLRVVGDRLSLRWQLGYDLTEPLPDHSSLTRIRHRYGLEVFRRFFEMIVEQCIDAGLVWGEELYLDATKVAANAALDSLQPRFAVEAHLAQLFAAADDNGDGGGGLAGAGGDEPVRLPVALTAEAQADLADRAAHRHDWIAQAGRPDRTVTCGTYRRTADFRVSTTDPDATPMPLGNGRTRLGYQDHYVVDGGRARIILTALAAPAEVQENQLALDLLWRARFRWKLQPRQVTADTKYGTSENIVAIEQEHIRAYFPLSAVGQRAGMFGEHDFVYDAGADTYQCPGGQILSDCRATQRRIYAAPAAVCRICALKPKCTTSSRGRRVRRRRAEPYLDRVRSYHATEAYKKAMRKRQAWVEPLFAEAKVWHGLRCFRRRGLANINIEGLLVAAGQNLKRWLVATGWERRYGPCGSLVAFPKEPQGLSAVFG